MSGSTGGILMRRQAGDTIIEVLLAMAVIGGMLSATFVTVNKTLGTARQSEERAQAVKVAETQLERLKVRVTSNSGSIFTASRTNFCMDSGAQPQNNSAFPALNLDNFSTYSGSCEQTQGGVKYYINIEHPNPTAGVNFSVNIRWDRLNGGQNNGKDQLIMKYNLYP